MRSWIAIAVLVLAGCTEMIRPAEVPTGDPIRPKAALPVGLQPPEIEIPRGTLVGGHALNPNKPYDVVHRWGERFSIDQMEFNFALRDELTSHGYRFAIGQQASYRLKPTITRLVYNLFGTDPRAGWTEAEVTVRWELEGPRSLALVTRGTATVREHTLASVFQAFRSALRNLLAEPQVAATLTGEAPVVAEPTPTPSPAPTPPTRAPSAPMATPKPAAPPVERVLTRPAGASSSLDPGGVVQNGRHGVVTILAGDGWASGVVLAADGLIVTQAASVQDVGSVTVVMHEGTERPARIIRTDEALGLALLQAEGAGFRPVPVRLQPVTAGEVLTGLGTPFHPALSFSVTRGKATGMSGPHLQTDVRISPGNAGGPLFDDRARVVGVVVWPAGSDAPSGAARAIAGPALFRALGLAYGQ